MTKVDQIIDELKNNVDNLKKSQTPKIIFIGGIPGSGKSLLIKKTQNEFFEDDFSIIEPDIYRKNFIEAKTVEETVEDCNKIELEILLYSIKTKKNIIHISSLRAYDYINYLIKEFILPLGYEVYLYIMVTDKVNSSISTYERYIYDKNNILSFPRLNKLEYLNQAYEGFELSLDFFSKVNYFKNVKIFTRGENKSLPIEIKIPIFELRKYIELEEKKQEMNIDPNVVATRIEIIKDSLKTENEIFEFNKVVNNIVYNKSYKKNNR